MSIILQGIHARPDIWVLFMDEQRTGFHMLTPAAKKWANEFAEPDSPADLEGILWVHAGMAGQVLSAIEKTKLNVILDDCEEARD